MQITFNIISVLFLIIFFSFLIFLADWICYLMMRGRSYSYSPSSPQSYGRKGRSPSPRGHYGGHYGGRRRDLPTSLLVRNLHRDCRYVYMNKLSNYVRPSFELWVCSVFSFRGRFSPVFSFGRMTSLHLVLSSPLFVYTTLWVILCYALSW